MECKVCGGKKFTLIEAVGNEYTTLLLGNEGSIRLFACHGCGTVRISDGDLKDINKEEKK